MIILSHSILPEMELASNKKLGWAFSAKGLPVTQLLQWCGATKSVNVCSSVCVTLSHWSLIPLSTSLPPAHMVQTCGARVENTVTHSHFNQITESPTYVACAQGHDLSWERFDISRVLGHISWWLFLVYDLYCPLIFFFLLLLLLSPLTAITLPEAADTEVYVYPDTGTAPGYAEPFLWESFFHWRMSSSLLYKKNCSVNSWFSFAIRLAEMWW